MSVAQPLLETIEADDPGLGNSKPTAPAHVREQVVLTPTTRTTSSGAGSGAQMANTPGDAEAGLGAILRQSAHPVALIFLYLFRTAAMVVYILYGWFTDNVVLSTVIVVVLLAADFWTCRNVSGRTLVGLRFWNQVDEDGESYWVFESRDPSRPANPIDSKMFWIALYAYPALWAALFVVALLKFGFPFLPIVALVFNITNVVGFTYADRDAKQKWANSMTGGWGLGALGGLGGQIISGAVKKGVGKVFG